MPTANDLAQRVGITLFDHQREFFEAMSRHPDPHALRACLFYKTGAGKSFTSLAAVAVLGYTKCIVIAPPSTHKQWIALGDQLKVQVEPMSHAKFRQKTLRLSRTLPIIADEFHMFGGQKGQGWRKLDALALHLQAPLILCSATPNYNDAERCYCVKHILDPQGTKGGYIQFIYQNCTTEQNPFGMEPKVTGFLQFSNAAEYLASLSHVYYLPDDLVVDINEVDYVETVPDELTSLGYDRRNHRVIASLMERRHTIRYQGLVNEHGYIHSHVFRDLCELMSQAPRGVMIFAVHATIATALERTFMQSHTPCLLVTGDSSKDSKEQAIQQFKDGRCDVLIGTATLATGTDGLDRVCDTLIILDDTDDDALRRQLIGRIMPRGDYVSSTTKEIFRLSPAS